jgi:hypothetical protein
MNANFCFTARFKFLEVAWCRATPALTVRVLFFLIPAHHKKIHVASAMLTFSDFSIIKKNK